MDAITKIILYFYVLVGFVAGLNWWIKFVNVPHETQIRQIEIGMLAWVILNISRNRKGEK